MSQVKDHNRVICCGRPDCGDDAAGPLVHQKLLTLGVPAVRNYGDPLALLNDFDSANVVILVDAVMTGASAGTVSRWDARRARLLRSLFHRSTHTCGLADAIELARVLNCLPPVLALFGIEGDHFDPGSPPSIEVEAAVEEVARRIQSELCSSFVTIAL